MLLSLSCGVFSAAFLANAYNPVGAFMETFDSYIVLPFLDPGKVSQCFLIKILAQEFKVMHRSSLGESFR